MRRTCPSRDAAWAAVTAIAAVVVGVGMSTARDAGVRVLCDMFPQFERHAVMDVLASAGGSVEAAVPVLARLVERADGDTRTAATESLGMLQELFPAISVPSLASALQACGGDASAAAEMLASGGPEPASRWAPVGPYTTAAAGDAEPSGLWGATDATRSRQPPPISDRADRREPSTFQQTFAAIVSRTSPATLADAADLRDRAQHYLDMRNEAFRRAAQSYARGDLTGRGAAFVYAERGRELSARMKDRNDRAAEAQLLANRCTPLVCVCVLLITAH
ncbi:hypothetical protein BC831DRAFT_443158 [Entophlyctis helioformis]|nr:hypothetical protein BC831DRAFT_443158 [Entophlyctis helioformis]